MLTDDEALAARARMIAQHGQTEKKHDHRIEGRNSRLDGIQAAILSVKLKHLPRWTEARRRIARRYREELQGVVDAFQEVPDGHASVYHLFTVEVANRNTVAEALVREGIATAVQYPTPLPLLQAYERFGHQPDDFPVATRICSRILSIPMCPELTEEQQTRVIDAVRRAVRHASTNATP